MFLFLVTFGVGTGLLTRFIISVIYFLTSLHVPDRCPLHLPPLPPPPPTHIDKCLGGAFDWLVGCFGVNGPLRQSISGRLPERLRGRKKREMTDERKNVQTTPTRTYCKCSRPLPFSNPNKQNAPVLEVNPAPSHHPTYPCICLRSGVCGRGGDHLPRSIVLFCKHTCLFGTVAYGIVLFCKHIFLFMFSFVSEVEKLAYSYQILFELGVLTFPSAFPLALRIALNTF